MVYVYLGRDCDFFGDGIDDDYYDSEDESEYREHINNDDMTSNTEQVSDNQDTNNNEEANEGENHNSGEQLNSRQMSMLMMKDSKTVFEICRNAGDFLFLDHFLGILQRNSKAKTS